MLDVTDSLGHSTQLLARTTIKNSAVGHPNDRPLSLVTIIITLFLNSNHSSRTVPTSISRTSRPVLSVEINQLTYFKLFRPSGPSSCRTQNASATVGFLETATGRIHLLKILFSGFSLTKALSWEVLSVLEEGSNPLSFLTEHPLIGTVPGNIVEIVLSR